MALRDTIRHNAARAADFVREHKLAVAIPAAAIAVGTLAAATVAFLPAALAAVTGFKIAGFSLAYLVGGSTVAQALTVGAIAGLATAAVAGVGVGVAKLFTAVKNWFTGKPDVNHHHNAAAERVVNSSVSHSLAGAAEVLANATAQTAAAAAATGVPVEVTVIANAHARRASADAAPPQAPRQSGVFGLNVQPANHSLTALDPVSSIRV